MIDPTIEVKLRQITCRSFIKLRKRKVSGMGSYPRFPANLPPEAQEKKRGSF
jgi:hypothetical protein